MKFSYTISIFITIFTILIALQVSVIAGNTYYIAENGRDSNDGSIGSPWATLKYAVDQVGPGDTILIRGGNYYEGKFYIENGGANGQFVTIKPYPGEEVNWGVQNEEARIAVYANYVRIEGIKFRNTKLRTSHGGEYHHIQFVNNHLKGDHNIGAIEYTASDGLIEGNIIECDNKAYSYTHGIYLHFGKNNIIRNNYIATAPAYNIHIYDEDKGSHRLKRYENILVENNTIVGAMDRSGIIIGAHDNTVEMDGIVIRNNLIINNYDAAIFIKYEPIKNIEIYNNVIYGNKRGIRASADIDGFKIQNNIFSSNNQIHIDISGNISNSTISHNLYHQSSSLGSGVNDSNPIYGDPLFVNAGGEDFHLRQNSPAIDAGVDVGLPYTGNKPDLGAFEYGQVSSVENLALFKASIKGSAVELEWQIKSKANIRGFAIERSKDNIQYDRIGIVKASGNSKSQNYKLLDKAVKEEKYYYRLIQVYADGSFKYSSTIEIRVTLPKRFNLEQNYPNPFNPSTEICYNLPHSVDVDLAIFDILGRHIKTLVTGNQPEGKQAVTWDGKDKNNVKVSSGMYLYCLKAGGLLLVKKMILSR